MLHIHRAERADGLITALGALLADPLPDPFAAEIVSVPTRGMERWLTQRLSGAVGTSDGRSDGVCANVGFPSPRRLLGAAVAAASGIEPDADPWLPERMVWPLLDVVDEQIAEPWLETLAAHLGAASEPPDPVRQARRFGSVRHIAELFDRYALHRPEMMMEWAAGGDGGVPDGAFWQAELWRRLRERIGAPDMAERLAGATARLEREPDLVDLPARLSLFGLTRLPAGHLHVLRALGAHRDVHLFLLHPSPALWARVAEATGGGRDPVIRRQGDPTATLASNRLLASWGHDSRELQLVIEGGAADHTDHHHPVPEKASDTLLGRLQADVRADRLAPGAPLPGDDDERPPLAAGDRSIEVHACHGRARQVEVVRDAILHLLAADPTLEPRDVIVMCPDIESFAPLIQATFGAGEVSDEDDELDALPEDVRPPDLRVKLADRALRQTNPVLGVVDRLIGLAGQRITASEVLDLADREPVRRRFRFDDDDLARMEDWVAASGVRWGLDAAHRAPYKLDALDAGTWRAGLDRMLVGVTMTEDEGRLFGGVLPLDDVDSGAIDLAGRFAELVDRLRRALDSLTEPKPIDAWARAIATAADALTATIPWDTWQRAELQRLLDDAVREATSAGAVHGTDLALQEIRALLADRLSGRPTRTNFRTGALTVCTLVPMRSVPHRVVCLLGLDDAVFPRKAPRDGDDLILEDQHVGDRDSRTEDRQMLLDALMAATDRLIVTYTGNDERTNAPRPPAVPVGELLDAVDRTVRPAGGDDSARGAVVVRHPLQPFDPRNFTPGELGRDGPWSFDRVTLEGARALIADRSEPEPFLHGPLPGEPAAALEVEQVVKFVEHPVRAFLRQRLGISVGDFFEEVEDALPIELDALEKWGVGQRLLDARLGGAGMEAAIEAEIARGTLPPGALAAPAVRSVRPTVGELAVRAGALLEATGEQGSLDLRIALGDGRTLSGTVPGVSGDVVCTFTFSRAAAKHRLASWVRLLALTAAHPERPFEAVVLGRAMMGAPRGMNVSMVRIPALGPDAETRRDVALTHLRALVDLYDRGMREPLPIACKSSAAYAVAAAAGRKPAAAAGKEWESGWKFDQEDRELEHQLVYGGQLTLEELMALEPREGESGEGWDESEPSRFGRMARRLWDGLLAVEQVTHA